MLQELGLDSAEDLFKTIPKRLLNPKMSLPEALSEQELTEAVTELAGKNRPLSAYESFLGAGVYQRFSPAIVRATISRPEFYSAYTPYQAEASQGTLQTIFEFQTGICELTGLDVANASLYDGATACAEAMIMAIYVTGRKRLAVHRDVHPESIATIRTFAEARRAPVDILDDATQVTEEHAAVLVAQPSFLGTVFDWRAVTDAAHKVSALAVCSVDLHACCIVETPGAVGFDIAVGDAQPLGIPVSFGGPFCGFMAVKQELMRRIPGRLVGMTHDVHGNRAYTLTLQTREQHIRREKATSNICTNHALMALAATVYMGYMGFAGMRRIAEVSMQRAHHLAHLLESIDGFSVSRKQPFLWEFVLRVPWSADEFAAEMRHKDIVAGLPLPGGDGSELLVCCTEMTSPAAILHYVTSARAVSARKLEKVQA